VIFLGIDGGQSCKISKTFQRRVPSPSSGPGTKPSKKQAASIALKMEALRSLETCTKIYGATFQKTELFIDIAEST
jgi:hypothetical protein